MTVVSRECRPWEECNTGTDECPNAFGSLGRRTWRDCEGNHARASWQRWGLQQ